MFRARRAQLGLWVLVVVSGTWLVVRDSKLWFGGDDWFILLDRRVSPGPGQLGLFEPHNEHWSTVPILVFRAFDGLFGVREYWPYVLLLVVVHLAIVVLLWHVMVRSAIDPWLSLGFVAIIAIPGPGFENLTNVWQVQLISPLALGLGALLLLPERGPLGWRDGVASLLLTIGMACSGLGITMLGVVALVALVRRGWRVALTVAAVPAVAYTWWYLAYGSQSRDVTALSYPRCPGSCGTASPTRSATWCGCERSVWSSCWRRSSGWSASSSTGRSLARCCSQQCSRSARSSRSRSPVATCQHHRGGVVALRVHHHRVGPPAGGGGARLVGPAPGTGHSPRSCPWSPAWSSW